MRALPMFTIKNANDAEEFYAAIARIKEGHITNQTRRLLTPRQAAQFMRAIKEAHKREIIQPLVEQMAIHLESLVPPEWRVQQGPS